MTDENEKRASRAPENTPAERIFCQNLQLGAATAWRGVPPAPGPPLSPSPAHSFGVYFTVNITLRGSP